MKIRAMTAAGMALALCACGDRQEPAAETSGTGATTSQVSAQARAGDSAVAAKLESSGPAVAGLWFEVETRPVAGQPFALKLQLSAPQPVPALHLVVDPHDLSITPDSVVVALAEASQPVTREFMVTAPEAGLFDLRVRLAATEGGAETTYAIPLLVAAAE